MTPAELALELGRSQRRVRAVLRARYGVLTEGVGRWEMTDEQVAFVRDTIAGETSPATEWSLEIGDTVKRKAVHHAYGGQEQGGISTPKGRSDIFIFTDRARSALYGYDKHEKLHEDGTFTYTGAGRYGPQSFTPANAAIRDSAAQGRIIRLFSVKGTLVTYAGAFTTDVPSYTIKEARDMAGDLRPAIIFNLVPLEADENLLAAPADQGATLSITNWTPPSYTDISMSLPVQLELGERAISRIELELQAAFGVWLAEEGHPAQTMRLPIGGTQIVPDFYVPSRKWIVEAKKSSGRGYVRTAIGQVLDYAHIAKIAGKDASPVILLPGRPEPDLVELISQLGIILASRTDDGFELLPAASVD